jgi:hypothetical protein
VVRAGGELRARLADFGSAVLISETPSLVRRGGHNRRLPECRGGQAWVRADSPDDDLVSCYTAASDVFMLYHAVLQYLLPAGHISGVLARACSCSDPKARWVARTVAQFLEDQSY